MSGPESNVLLLLVPPPHVLEHSCNIDQLDHWQSTGGFVVYIPYCTLLHGIAKKRKNYCGGGGIRSPTPPASRGGSGGAPDHSAIQLDGDRGSYS